MTDEQKADLARDRMKSAGQDMVTVPRAALLEVITPKTIGHYSAGIEILRKAAGIEL
jgi:hypothetical protein